MHHCCIKHFAHHFLWYECSPIYTTHPMPLYQTGIWFVQWAKIAKHLNCAIVNKGLSYTKLHEMVKVVWFVIANAIYLHLKTNRPFISKNYLHILLVNEKALVVSYITQVVSCQQLSSIVLFISKNSGFWRITNYFC